MAKLSLPSPNQLPGRPPVALTKPAQSADQAKIAKSADPARIAKSADPARIAKSADPARMAKSAGDFEAMAIGQLLQPMFDTVNTSKSAFGGGTGEEAWKPMLVQEFAKQIAAHGGLGLAKPVYEAMQRMQETKPK
jgi:flagellar protein FlgJ